MAETLILDPVEVAVARTSFDITPYVAESGPDFGEAAIEQYLADVQEGQLPVDYRVPSRTITIPLLLTDRGTGLTFEQVRAKIQQKTALFQREGGWIKRQTSIGSLYADITSATLKFGGSTAQALWGIDADAVLTVIALPDWYANEIVGTTVTQGATAAELITVISGVKGDHSARTRIVLTEPDSKTLRGLMWGMRSRTYSNAATARLAYEAEALTVISPAVTASDSTSSGGMAVKVPGTALTGNWLAVLTTDLAGVGSLTHVGTYHVWARIYVAAVATPDVSVRLVWDVGDLVMPVENPSVLLGAGFLMVDLGEVRLVQPPVGVHRWQGVVQVRGANAPDIYIDRLWFQPVDEGAGRLSVGAAIGVGATGYSALDGFDGHTVGTNVTAAALPVGGVWTGGGSATDFKFDAVSGSSSRIQRTGISDTGIALPNGYLPARTIYAGTPVLTTVAVQADLFFYVSAKYGGGNQAAHVIFRYVDSANYAYAVVYNVPGAYMLNITAVVGGAPTSLNTVGVPFVAEALWTLRAVVLIDGSVAVWLYPQGSEPGATPKLTAAPYAALATGGALASGKVGVGNSQTSTNPNATPFLFDNFAAWVPDVDAILYPLRSAELRHDGMFREAIGGSNFGPVSTVIGDLPRLPPAGLEGRSTELLLKVSEGNFEQAPDTSRYPRVTAQVRYRPTYLIVPEA